MNPRIPIILDMDTGIDDALAIIYALQSPTLEVLGITTCFGNGDVATTTRNTLMMVELSKHTVPVYAGARDPLVGQFIPTAEAFHGRNGLGGLTDHRPQLRAEAESAVDYLRRIIRSRPGEITLVVTGRLTNLANALNADPGLGSLIKRVVLMGGAAFVGGNVTPVSEANIWGDPEAAWVVFHSGVELVMVGLDVTMQVMIEDAQVSGMDPRRAYTPVIQEALDFYLAAYNPGQPKGHRQAPLHDPLAVAVAEDPSLCELVGYPVDIELGGTMTRGMTVVDRRSWIRNDPNVLVCQSVDRERFLREFCTRLGFPLLDPGSVGPL